MSKRNQAVQNGVTGPSSRLRGSTTSDIDDAMKRVAKELNAEIWDLPVTELEIVAQEIRQKLDTGVIMGVLMAYAKKRVACIDAAVKGMKRLIAAHK